ncbi:hypothetical protein Tco_1160293 [Tanacetum coccineum]
MTGNLSSLLKMRIQDGGGSSLVFNSGGFINGRFNALASQSLSSFSLPPAFIVHDFGRRVRVVLPGDVVHCSKIALLESGCHPSLVQVNVMASLPTLKGNSPPLKHLSKHDLFLRNIARESNGTRGQNRHEINASAPKKMAIALHGSVVIPNWSKNRSNIRLRIWDYETELNNSEVRTSSVLPVFSRRHRDPLSPRTS